MSVKRMVFSATGTVAGLVGLLQFKTATATPTQPESLPSAALPSSSTTAPATTAPSTSAASTSAASTAAPSTSAATSSAATTRTLTGTTASNRYGDVQVQVTVQGSKIVDVQFVQLTAYDRHSEEINNYAGPILLQETLQAQSAQIDGVSGATYTTDSYLESLQSALDQL